MFQSMLCGKICDKLMIFDNILKLILLLSPIMYTRLLSLNQLDGYLFTIGVILIFVGTLAEKPVRTLTNTRYYISFLGLLLLNVFLHFRVESLVYTVNASLTYLLAVVVITSIVRYCRDPKQIYPYVIAAGVLNLIMFTIQHNGYNPIPQTSDVLAGGFIGQQVRYSTYIALIMPFIIDVSVLLFIVCLVSCLVEVPQTGLLIVSFILLLIRYNNKYVRLSLVSLFIASVGYYHDWILKALNVRWVGVEKNSLAYKRAIEYFCAAPLDGWGIGAVGASESNVEFDVKLNGSMVQFVFELGILSFWWLYKVLKGFIKNFDKSVESQAVLILLIMCLIEYPLEIPRLKFTILFIISAFIIKITNRRKENVNYNKTLGG